MPFAKLGPAVALAAVALSACGTSSPPLAGTIEPNGKPIGRGRIDNPLTTHPNHLRCLLKTQLPLIRTGPRSVRIGSAASGPSVVFEATPGIAQGDVLQGIQSAQGAEVIGSALLYPNGGSDSELKKIEVCLAQGVSG
jgi:hypothetical protein